MPLFLIWHLPEGAFFREFITDELVKSIDALSRDQLARLVLQLGLQGAQLPVFLPGSRVRSLPLAPSISEEDRKVVDNVAKLVAFLAVHLPQLGLNSVPQQLWAPLFAKLSEQVRWCPALGRNPASGRRRLPTRV